MHNILFFGDLVDGFELDQVKANLSTLFKIDDDAKIAALFSGKQVTLKKNLDAAKANKYLAILHKAGIECRIDPPVEDASDASDDQTENNDAPTSATATTSTASMNFNTIVAASVDTAPEPAQSFANAEPEHSDPYGTPESNFETLAVNDSGSGKDAVLPAEASGLSWGAFFFSWIWGLFNNVYIALLALIPLVGLFVIIWLLFVGKRLAWENKRWESVEHFNRVQKRWGLAGLALFVITIGFYCMLFISAINSARDLSSAAMSEETDLESMLSETDDPEMREAMRNLNELMKQAEAEAQAYEARDKAEENMPEQ